MTYQLYCFAAFAATLITRKKKLNLGRRFGNIFSEEKKRKYYFFIMMGQDDLWSKRSKLTKINLICSNIYRKFETRILKSRSKRISLPQYKELILIISDKISEDLNNAKYQHDNKIRPKTFRLSWCLWNSIFLK